MLFEPLNIGTLRVPGRLFKSATSETRASRDGLVTDQLLEFYEPIAYAGTPLIVTGNLYVSPAGRSTYRMCGIDSEDKVPGLRRLADLVHDHGSTLFAQLNHCGRQVIPAAVGLTSALSASAVRDPVTWTKPRPMTGREIEETVADFAAAAARAQAAGFDGVQIHAGHGYLISQFLTPHTNRRRDEYGGCLRNRMRLLLEVHSAIRSRVGDDYPVIAKLNGSDSLRGRAGLKTPELVEVARALEQEGLDGVEISVGFYESGAPMIRGSFDGFFRALVEEGAGAHMPAGRRRAARAAGPLLSRAFNALWPYREGFNLELAGQFKAALAIPVICVGGFQTSAGMERAIESASCDAVSVARAMIADPLLWMHLREGVEGPRCSYCNGCIARAGGSPIDCYDPAVKRQRDTMLSAHGFPSVPAERRTETRA